MGLLGCSHDRPSALDGDGHPGPSSLQHAPGSYPSRSDGALSPVTPPRHTSPSLVLPLCFRACLAPLVISLL